MAYNILYLLIQTYQGPKFIPHEGVFSGTPSEDDIRMLKSEYNCCAIVVKLSTSKMHT
jgi:hypothetical protein